jgi:hypothetical protein
LDAFFRDATREQAWHDDEERAEVEKFKGLVQALTESLADIKVFQVGGAESDVYIVGRTSRGGPGRRRRPSRRNPRSVAAAQRPREGR